MVACGEGLGDSAGEATEGGAVAESSDNDVSGDHARESAGHEFEFAVAGSAGYDSGDDGGTLLAFWVGADVEVGAEIEGEADGAYFVGADAEGEVSHDFIGLDLGKVSTWRIGRGRFDLRGCGYLRI